MRKSVRHSREKTRSAQSKGK